MNRLWPVVVLLSRQATRALRAARQRARPAVAQSFAAALLGVAAVLVAASGCVGAEGAREEPPAQRYGYRYEAAAGAPGSKEQGSGGRVTLAVTAAEEGREYSYYDAPVSEVTVRTGPFAESAEASGGPPTAPVELLVEGALPNSCVALHEAEQDRDGHFIGAALVMRWPMGAGRECERYRQPFRFYLPLEGRYAPGDYTLKLNGTVYPFSVRRE